MIIVYLFVHIFLIYMLIMCENKNGGKMREVRVRRRKREIYKYKYIKSHINFFKKYIIKQNVEIIGQF